ncbi:helix-turn-helix domain-containing protein [Streptomyces sp. NPDC004288]
MTTTTDPVAQRRATVAQLLRDDHSQRDIAQRLGVSKDVIYRDVQALARGTATAPDQDPAEPDAPAASPITAVALPIAPEAATPSRDTAPRPAAAVTLPLTAGLVADLATLTRNGIAPEVAVRDAVAIVARAYRQAWDAGAVPRDATPVMARYQFASHTPSAPPTPASRASPVPSPEVDPAAGTTRGS